MRFLLLLALLGAVVAQYGGQAPSYPSAPVPSGQVPIIPWYPPHPHYSRSDSRSRSRFDSREKKRKCKNCKKLKKFRDSSITTLVAAKIKYIRDRKDCVQAVIRCPFDNESYTLYVGKDKDDTEKLATGFFIERTVKCNRKGNWRTDDGYRFEYAGCQDNGILTPTPTSSTPTPSPTPTPTPTPADCGRCGAPVTRSGDGTTPPNIVEGNPIDGCPSRVASCPNIDGIQTLLEFKTSDRTPVSANFTGSTLICNSEEQWTFVVEGTPHVVTEVACIICGQCPNPESIYLDSDPVPTAQTSTAGGCSTATVTCPAPENIPTLIAFQEGGPTPDGSQADLVCSSEMEWTYAGSPVTQIECVTPACARCDVLKILPSEGVFFSVTTLGSSEGCVTVRLICNKNAEGTQTYVNLGETPVDSITEVILACSEESEWTFNEAIVSSTSCVLLPV